MVRDEKSQVAPSDRYLSKNDYFFIFLLDGVKKSCYSNNPVWKKIVYDMSAAPPIDKKFSIQKILNFGKNHAIF
jgi:hypothetical protein